jgi:hypothetical protein
MKVSKNDYKRYTDLITEKKNDYVFDLDRDTRTLGNVKFAKYETDGSFTLEQQIEINIYSIYVLVDILKSEVQQLESDNKSVECIPKIAVIKKLERQLELLQNLKQYYNYKATLAAVLPFRHKKSRRRGSKSVKRRRKLRSKSKSRKLSPKIFRR